MADAQVSAPALAPPTDLPVQWENPEDAQFFWNQDRMHYPDPLSPLASTFITATFGIGNARASEQLGTPIKRRIRALNGHIYVAVVPVSSDSDEMARIQSEVDGRLRTSAMSLERDWYQRYLPELEADVAAFRSFDYAGATDGALADHVDWVVARRIRHYHLHFLTVIPQQLAINLFNEAYKQIFGVSDNLEAQVLLQGLPNRTVDSGHALWQLSRLATRSASVREAVSESEPDVVFERLQTAPEGREFAEAFRAYLDEFGWRGDGFGMDDRTWIEYPKRPLATLRGYIAQPDEASPVAVQESLAAKREAAIAGARARLASAPAEDRARFEALLRPGQLGVVLHEDHNYIIDQMLMHMPRRAFVEAGKRLVARGRITTAEDVLYLTVPELQAAIRSSDTSDLRDTVDERRKRHEHQRSMVPSPSLGTPPPQVSKQSEYEKGMANFWGGKVEQSGEASQMRGNAGSRGKVTGIALVALNLEQAAGLRPGEILVCPTTAPSWTPLFATAGAVVTDTGGILSHCAVVAREFGIPAVVGTHVATSRIKSGQRITVDGSRGIVTMEPT